MLSERDLLDFDLARILVSQRKELALPFKCAFDNIGSGCVFKPNRNLMSPPQLPTNRPIPLLAEPIEIALGITLREDLDATVRDSIHCRLRKLVHFDKPLIRQIRLNRRLAPVAVRQL